VWFNCLQTFLVSKSNPPNHDLEHPIQQVVLKLSYIPNLEGANQHGFRSSHSTVTALLSIQAKMAEIIDNHQYGNIYSVDLSAAFDLLKPDKFLDLFKDILTEGLLFALADFLTHRIKFVLELSGKGSN